MGFLKVFYNDLELPIKVTALNRNLTSSLNHETKKIGNSGGVMLLSSAYAEKTITIEYIINHYTAQDLSKFRAEMAKIITAKETKQLYFSDEPNRYYDAIITGEQPLNEDYLQSAGTLTFLVPDGLAHSVITKQFAFKQNDDGILETTIKNEGTASVPVNYKIENNSDNGFVGIVSEHGAIQFGKVSEADGENYKKNEWLITLRDFIDAPNDTTGTDVMHPTHGVKGTLKTSNWFGKPFLTLGSAGDLVGSSNGGLRTILVPEDSEGNAGAKNFYAYFHLAFYAGIMGQTGEMCISWLTKDNKMIAGVNWYKTDTVANTGHYELWANGKVLKNYQYTTSHLQSQNPWYWDWGHCDLQKEGSSLKFFYYGTYISFNIPEVEDMECTKIQIACKQYGTRNTGPQLLTYMGFDVFEFQKMHVEKWRDVPNRYGKGDELFIDGGEAKFYVNGMPKLGDEITGSKYFLASPGETKIQFLHSEFSDPPPNVTAEIREAWL